jgi:hypothetical protein
VNFGEVFRALCTDGNRFCNIPRDAEHLVENAGLLYVGNGTSTTGRRQLTTRRQLVADCTSKTEHRGQSHCTRLQVDNCASTTGRITRRQLRVDNCALPTALRKLNTADSDMARACTLTTARRQLHIDNCTSRTAHRQLHRQLNVALLVNKCKLTTVRQHANNNSTSTPAMYLNLISNVRSKVSTFICRFFACRLKCAVCHGRERCVVNF